MFPVLLASLLATPLGWGIVSGTNIKCDRLQVYNTETDTKWVACADRLFEIKKNKTVDRTLRR